ncbi:MAG: hypothetical protein V4687_18385 [Bacteroidota bacterium]
MKKSNFRFFAALLLLFGCSGNEKPRTFQSGSYFDSKTYFKAEAARLSKLSPKVSKCVEVNKLSETRRMKIADWNKEFNSFVEAGINRTSWKGLFTVQKSGESTTYKSVDEKIPVKKLIVILKERKVIGIKVFVQNKNLLYASTDSLIYFPDSLYQIKKYQNIRFLTNKTFSITGRF